MLLLAEIAGPRKGLELMDWLGVGLYLVVTFVIVVWASRRQNDTEEYFLGSRRIPWIAVGMSLLATLLSTITYLGSPGEMIKNGITMFAGYMAIPFSMVVVLFLWMPFFMRLKMTSAYEYLENRFDSRVRFIASVLFLLLRLGWMSLVVYTASLALHKMAFAGTEVQLNHVIACVSIAATIYAFMGGIEAVIWNDVLQFIMLFGGTFVTIIYIAYATGTGPMDWWDIAKANSEKHVRPEFFSWDITVRMTIVTAMLHNFFWTICTHGSDQVVLQRYFSTTSLKAARKSYIVNEISGVAIGSLLGLSGLALFAFYTKHPNFLANDMTIKTSSDDILPYFFAHQLPAGFGGLILAGFLCDAMQTLESGVNSITAILTRDVFTQVVQRTNNKITELFMARILTAIAGLTVMFLAFGVANTVQESKAEAQRISDQVKLVTETHGIEAAKKIDQPVPKSIVDLMPRSFNMFLGPLASMFVVGMFLPRCTGRSMIPAVFFGLFVSITWSYWREICALIGNIYPAIIPWGAKAPTITMAIALPFVSSCLVAAILGLLVERRRDENPGRAYTWFEVMKRPI